MSQNLTKAEQQRLAAVNIQVARQLGQALKNPEVLADIPNGAVVFPITTDAWINEQNEKLAAIAVSEGKPVHWIKIEDFTKTQSLNTTEILTA
ncbi:hypothetical protein [Synechococcus sp. PCC 6312]|uniref:hypothetical protein n=1 Tax=Synechococcus sp. (strain ATCC 27167 / PCC 6312) TaxID=195253 RepID=UPI00029F4B89|nr:hypothetical protein [Synechococcus sp. PCC 6312]AFY59273.1 hypothetical protein Syn6312_0014 [Synechococcus sp. PCC 6312]